MRPLFPAKRLLGRAYSNCLAAGRNLFDSGPIDGFVVALFLVAIWHQLGAFLGGSLATDFSVGWAIAIGATLGFTWGGRRGWLLLGLSAWAAILGGLLSTIGWGLKHVSAEQLAFADGLSVALPAATLVLAIPVALSVRLCLLDGGRRARGFLIGAAAGAAVSAHLLIGRIGVDALLLVVAVIGGVQFLGELKRGGRAGAGTRTGLASHERRFDGKSAVVLVVLGGVLASLDRMLGQLVPASECYLLMMVSGLCLGAAVSQPGRKHVVTVSLSAVLLLVPAVFPELIDGLLHLKTVGGHPAVLVTAWSILVSVAVMPVGMLLAISVPRQSNCLEENPARLAWPIAPVLFLVGLFLGRWLLVPVAGPIACAIAGSVLLAVAAAVAAVRSEPKFRRMACPVLLVAGLAVLCGRYNPERSARLLFSGRVIAAAQREWPRRLHESLDGSRIIDRRETSDATLTVWSQRGVSRLLRVDGIPAASWSEDSLVSPRQSSEILSVVLPLVLHERPERVLQLGLGGGEGLRAGLGFPLNRIDCVEPNRGLRELVAQDAVFDDVRLSWRHLSPALDVSSGSGDYDVVIATSVAPVSWRSESIRTVEFYRNAARQLAPDGIFCQVLSQRDVGSTAVTVPHSTIRAAFGLSVQVPVGSGRVLVLASNGETLLDRSGFVGRLQGPHVRAVLAEMGWDWANILQLPVQQMSEQAERTIYHVGSGWLAVRLPVAALAGGMSQDKALDPARPLLNLVTVEDQWVAELRERLADLLKGQKLLSRGSDGLRTYRSAVDQQIIGRPRFVFESDSNKGLRRLRHPVDRRRQQFLRVLGAIEKVEQPTPDQIEQVVSFAEPFDPLLSEFVHREVAGLWLKRPGDTGTDELQHRLHAVYFGRRPGESVDDVHMAIRSLLRVEPTRGEAAVLWDHCNSLLEALKQRWSVDLAKRGGWIKASATIELVGELFDRMDRLVELDSRLGDRWDHRREVIERGLIEPLRIRRSQRPLGRRATRVLAN